MKIKYDVSMMKYMSLFEKQTKALLKDCFMDDVLSSLTFIVQPGQLGKAVGKKGVNAKKLEKMLQKNIRIIEFNPDLLQFVKNMVAPLKVADIKQEESIVIITGPDTRTKGLLIGRNAQNLRNLEKNVRRYFEVEEIKVV